MLFVSPFSMCFRRRQAGKNTNPLAHCHRRVLPKDGHIPLSSSRLHPSPHQQQARLQSPDLIWMIKTFFFSTNFLPPPITTTTLVCQPCTLPYWSSYWGDYPNSWDYLPTCWLHRGGGGGHVRHDVQVCNEGGGAGNAKSGPLYCLGANLWSTAASETSLERFLHFLSIMTTFFKNITDK